jgi:cytoskeleton protein RodZ
MTSPDQDEDYSGTPRVTSRVGADLRAARERLGWTLPAIAAYLRIRLPFLEAIEDGRIGDLPGNAYAVGFLRTYAQALGLEPDEVARRFKAEAADVNRKTELAFPAPVPERGIPAGAVVLVGVVIAVGAYIGWYRMSAVPERLAPLAATAAPAAPPVAAASDPATAQPKPSVIASAGPVGAPPAALPQIPSAQMMGPAIPPAIAASLAASQPPPIANAAAPNVPMPPTGAGAAVVVPGMPEGTRIVLRAKADAWVQVREKQGSVLLNRVLRNGETWPVPPNKQPLLLTTGNAAGTELIVDGTLAPTLGADGAVRRDLLLDPEMIRDGRLGPVPGIAQPQPPAVPPQAQSIPPKPASGAPGIPVTRTN